VIGRELSPVVPVIIEQGQTLSNWTGIGTLHLRSDNRQFASQEKALKDSHSNRILSTLTLAGVLALLGATAALQTGCVAFDSQASEPEAEEQAADTPEETKAVPVEIAALGQGPIEEVLRFSTNLEAEQAVGVYSQAARQVVDLLVEEGDRVAKGQVLLRLQDDEQRLQVAKVEGQLSKARREYDRQKRLYEDSLIPEQDFNQATYELKQLELQLEEAQRQLSYTEVRAPIRGTITRRLVNMGDQITVNQHLFDIVDFNSLVARVYVPEKELARLSEGLPARLVVPALGGAEYRGEVARLAPIVDPQSGTIKVTVGIPEWQGLRPGLYVDVALVTAVHEQALLVPKRALVYDQDRTFVYRLAAPDEVGEVGEVGELGEVTEDGEAALTVERIAVEPMLEDKQYVEPMGTELAAGDRLVIAGQAGLKDGAVVRVLDLTAAEPMTEDAPSEVATESPTDSARDAEAETAE